MPKWEEGAFIATEVEGLNITTCASNITRAYRDPNGNPFEQPTAIILTASNFQSVFIFQGSEQNVRAQSPSIADLSTLDQPSFAASFGAKIMPDRLNFQL